MGAPRKVGGTVTYLPWELGTQPRALASSSRSRHRAARANPRRRAGGRGARASIVAWPGRARPTLYIILFIYRISLSRSYKNPIYSLYCSNPTFFPCWAALRYHGPLIFQKIFVLYCFVFYYRVCTTAQKPRSKKME